MLSARVRLLCVFVFSAQLLTPAAGEKLRESAGSIEDFILDDNDNGDNGAYAGLRPSQHVDATEEFLNEIHPLRPAVLHELLKDLNEDDLIKEIEHPKNIHWASSLCQLGNLYDSQGDDNRALKCYQVAAEAFDMGGMYNYANALLLGKGCERNEKCGTAWLREAAAMVCDSNTFVKRHLPTRFYVREDGAEHKDELTIHHDDNGDATRVESSMSGSVLWDAATDSEEELQNLFHGLKLEVADSEVLNTSISSLPPPVPARASYRDAAIDVSAMLGNSDLAVSADFATGVVDVNALKNFDGSPRVLTSDELLAVALLSVSMNRGRADASQYTSDLLNSRGWARALELMHNRSAAGDGHVCAILGALYRNGLGVGEDREMAHALFLKAAEKGVPEAMNNLALSLMQEEGGNQNTLRACSQTGSSTLTGKKLEDLEESLEESRLLLRALGHESPESPEEEKKRKAQEALLAELKKKIKIEDPFPATKRKKSFPAPPAALEPLWEYVPTALKGAISVVCGSGRMSEAVMWLRKAAHAGCVASKHNLAVALEEEGSSKHLPRVAQLYHQAASLGYGASMNNLALLFLSGKHPKGKDIVKARMWLRKAAEEPSGVYLATENFKKEMFDGGGWEGRGDEEETERDLSKVPGKNPPKEALYNLGVLNELGMGARPNFQSASRWYSLAVEKGLRDQGVPTVLY